MSFEATSEEGEILSEINMTPLVDVMLVLLIIFMLTVPAMQNVVKLDLPRSSSNQVHNTKSQHINLFLYANHRLTWDDQPISQADLLSKLTKEAAQDPQPELHLYADGKVPYEQVAQLMATAQQSGLTRIGFVSQPTKSKP
jgi:biopolymer transport protein ExbD